MYSYTLLSAVLTPFLCTTDLRKIIVNIFVKQDDILTEQTHRLCMCMWCCLCLFLFFYTLIVSY
jgi:hypothetical protein